MERDDDIEVPSRSSLPPGPGSATSPQGVTVLDARPLVVLGVETALAGVREASGVLVVGRVEGAVEAVRAAAARERTVVLLLDDDDRPGRAAAALKAGVRGVALTSGSATELVQVIRRASVGEVAVPPVVRASLEELERLRVLFTPREQEVLVLYATGIPAKSVARRMDVAMETVKTYVKRVRLKAERACLPAQTKLDLFDLARRLDLV